MTTYARVPLEQAFDTLLAELDDLIGRVLRQEPHLYLEANEGDWQVADIANQNGVMLHSPDIMVCVRFMEAFAVKHPEATVERWSIAEAVRLANIAARKVAGEPKADVLPPMSPVSQAAPDGEPASPAQIGAGTKVAGEPQAEGRGLSSMNFVWPVAGASPNSEPASPAAQHSVKVPALRLVEAVE